MRMTVSHIPTEEATMTAAGPFEVKLTPQPSDKDAVLGRLTLDKTFHGDLEATSKGQMLAYSSSIKGSAGYVAMEHVTGTLGGRKGTFVLQHSGLMTRGNGQLTVTVVPDSGTERLVGLSGTMRIDIADGKHSYVFDYTVPAMPDLRCPTRSNPALPNQRLRLSACGGHMVGNWICSFVTAANRPYAQSVRRRHE